MIGREMKGNWFSINPSFPFSWLQWQEDILISCKQEKEILQQQNQLPFSLNRVWSTHMTMQPCVLLQAFVDKKAKDCKTKKFATKINCPFRRIEFEAHSCNLECFFKPLLTKRAVENYCKKSVLWFLIFSMGGIMFSEHMHLLQKDFTLLLWLCISINDSLFIPHYTSKYIDF